MNAAVGDDEEDEDSQGEAEAAYFGSSLSQRQ